MESIVAEGKSLVRQTSCGKRSGGEDDRIGDEDTDRGGSRNRSGDFDKDGGIVEGGVSGGGVDEGETGREEKHRACVRRAGSIQVRPQSDGVQDRVRGPEKEHLEWINKRVELAVVVLGSSSDDRGSRQKHRDDLRWWE